MGFNRSVGGNYGSSSIDTKSIAQSQAQGGPTSGYRAGQGWGGAHGQGAPLPEHGAKGNVSGVTHPTSQRKSPTPSIGNVPMKGGGSMPKPSRT
jgi:hypothetical protein